MSKSHLKKEGESFIESEVENDTTVHVIEERGTEGVRSQEIVDEVDGKESTFSHLNREGLTPDQSDFIVGEVKGT
jgi:hypothetical protein